MQTLGRVRHENLTPLLGCCVSGKDRFHIYKIMSNGSLDDRLHMNPPSLIFDKLRDFSVRLKVAVGAARGLRFLHHECLPVILHRDIKASNVLLDENCNAFLTDFGLARTNSYNDSHVSTMLVGTLGYVPPEYSQSGRASSKGNVYSFGVVLLELATGKRPLDDFTNMVDAYCGGMVEWARMASENRTIEDITDPVVKEWIGAKKSENFRASIVRKNAVHQIVQIAVECTKENPKERPSMIQVAHQLHQLYLELLFADQNA